MSNNLLKLLYIGNFLTKHGMSPNQGAAIVGILKKRGWDITYTSAMKNKVFRLISMIYDTFKFSISKHRKLSIIDLFSGSSYFYAIFLISLIHSILGINYILVCRGGNLPARIKNRSKIISFIFKNATAIVCPSSYLQNILVNKLNIKKTVIIPNGIDRKIYKRCDMKNVGNILFLRAFNKIYDPITLIKAFSIVLETVPFANLTLIGYDMKDGTYEKSLECIKLLGIKKNVVVKPPIEKSDIPLLADYYTTFVNCSIIDNTPVSTMEAMAMGMCIVGTNVGGIPHLIKDNYNSLIVPPQRENELADSILEIIKNNELAKRIGKQARKSSKSYDWKNVIEHWELQINKAMSK